MPAWRVDSGKFYTRLRELIEDPRLVAQNGNNLCGPAAFLRVWLERDPLAVARFAHAMFEHGEAKLGSTLIQPDADLTDADYEAADAAAHDDRDHVIPPSAEWVIMSSLRDVANNAGWDYEGELTTTEPYSGMTFPGDVVNWLRGSGLYQEVVDETNLVFRKGIAHALALDPGTDDVLMLVRGALLEDLTAEDGGNGGFHPPWPTHWVTLNDPITVTGDSVRVSLWSYGYKTPWVGDAVALDVFEGHYRGAVIARGNRLGVQSGAPV